MTEPTTAAIVHVSANEAQLAPIVPESKMQILGDVIAPGLNRAQLDVFAIACNRTRLDPFAKQIYGISRYDADLGRNKLTIQTSIDGFRIIAERTGKYGGRMPFEWCGKDGVWKDVWLDDAPPAAARARVVRKDWPEPIVAVARYKAYCQTKRDGSPTHMWKKMDAEQLAKCAEALGLRTAFPQELSGLYTDDEMDQAGEVTATTQRQESREQPAAKQLPPPAEGPRFGDKYHPDWAGRLIETAPPDVIAAYMNNIDEVLADKSRAKHHARAAAHKAEVEAVYDALMDREMAASEQRHKSTPPPAADPIAERLQQHIDDDHVDGHTTGQDRDAWGLTP